MKHLGAYGELIKNGFLVDFSLYIYIFLPKSFLYPQRVCEEVRISRTLRPIVSNRSIHCISSSPPPQPPPPIPLEITSAIVGKKLRKIKEKKKVYTFLWSL